MAHQTLRSTIAATLVALASLLGCSPDAPKPPPVPAVTAAGLASELTFRIKTIRSIAPEGPAAAFAPPAKTAKGKGTPPPKKVEAKKADPLDEAVADTVAKSAKIEGSTKAEACKEIADIIGKDTTLDEADRKLVATKLAAAAK